MQFNHVTRFPDKVPKPHLFRVSQIRFYLKGGEVTSSRFDVIIRFSDADARISVSLSPWSDHVFKMKIIERYRLQVPFLKKDRELVFFHIFIVNIKVLYTISHSPFLASLDCFTAALITSFNNSTIC